MIAISFYVIGGAFHGYGAVFKAELRGLDPQIRLAGRRANVFRNLQPWFTNTLKRIVKTPKLHFLDSGLLAGVRGLTFDRVKADRGTFGALLESFLFSEVLKLMTASDLRLTPYHFRDRDMREVDIVLERDDRMIAGIEVKASATVKAGDFGGLRALAEACGDRFAFGVVLYDNTDVVPFGDKLAAMPLSSMWG
nr:DUF4143 domain-containing protein [Rhizobium ruizarguesonis]